MRKLAKIFGACALSAAASTASAAISDPLEMIERQAGAYSATSWSSKLNKLVAPEVQTNTAMEGLVCSVGKGLGTGGTLVGGALIAAAAAPVAPVATAVGATVVLGAGIHNGINAAFEPELR